MLYAFNYLPKITLHKGEMKENNLDALHAGMVILIAGLGVLICFELKGNLNDSTV